MGGSDPVRPGSSGDGDSVVADGVEPVDAAAVESAGGVDAVHDPVDVERGEREAMIAVPRVERGPLGATVSGDRKVSRLEKRREKVRAEIERNRRGDFKVPTWVLAVALVVVVVGWVALIAFA